MAQNISVPDIGDFKDVEVIEVLVKPGDQINKNDPVVTIESDKSSVEIPSPQTGKIKDLKVKIFETALSNKRIEDVEFDMLPAMSANAGYTGSDRYKATTSATVPSSDKAGAMGSTHSTSRDREVNEQDIGFSWNALDFGLSYIRAGQSSDRYLISRELERKTASNIKRDVVLSLIHI